MSDERQSVDSLLPLVYQELRRLAASYLRRHGDTRFRALKFDVLRIENGVIAEITTLGPELFEAFGLPETL